MSDLSVFYQVSVSVFCIVATITFFVILISTLLFYRQLSKLSLKIEELIESAKSTTEDVKSFINTSAETIEQFKKGLFTLEIIRNIFAKIVNKFVNKTKGDENAGQE